MFYNWRLIETLHKKMNAYNVYVNIHFTGVAEKIKKYNHC